MKNGIEIRYNFDTNVIIDLVANKLSNNYKNQLVKRIKAGECAVSVIVVTEILAGDLSEKERSEIDDLISDMSIIAYTEALVPFGSSIRRQYGLKLPDAMIAATALFYGLTLISSDKRGFPRIDTLLLERPEMA